MFRLSLASRIHVLTQCLAYHWMPGDYCYSPAHYLPVSSCSLAPVQVGGSSRRVAVVYDSRSLWWRRWPVWRGGDRETRSRASRGLVLTWIGRQRGRSEGPLVGGVEVEGRRGSRWLWTGPKNQGRPLPTIGYVSNRVGLCIRITPLHSRVSG